jgi:hypothetical protein
VAIPVILLYNQYYLRHGIFAANRLIAFATVMVLLATLLVKSKNKPIADANVSLATPPVI